MENFDYREAPAKILKVSLVGNRQIRVYYKDGKIFDYDMTPDIQQNKFFQHLKDDTAFQKIYVAYEGNAIGWGDGDEWSDPTVDKDVPYFEGELVSE